MEWPLPELKYLRVPPEGGKSGFNPVSEAQPGMVEGKVNTATHTLRSQTLRKRGAGMETVFKGLATVVCIP